MISNYKSLNIKTKKSKKINWLIQFLRLLTVVAQEQFRFFVLVEIRSRHQVRFGALLDGEQPLGRARSVVNYVELMFVADANAARFHVAAAAGGRRLDQSDDRRLFGDLKFLRRTTTTMTLPSDYGGPEKRIFLDRFACKTPILSVHEIVAANFQRLLSRNDHKHFQTGVG